MEQRSTQVAALLAEIRVGNKDAERVLMGVVYEELRRVAARRMRRERPHHTLQATAVVHEAYLRMAGSGFGDINDKRHFFALAAKQMRSVLVDYARARAAIKRGAGAVQVEFQEADRQALPATVDVLTVDAALDQLQKDHPRVEKVVEYKFFGGYTDEKTAELLDLSLMTVRRDWKFARAWLLERISSRAGAPDELTKSKNA